MTRIDHIIYATPDLDLGMARIEALLGVSPVRGGKHPGYGTHNALLSLGEATYLEIIGPDPQDPEPEKGFIFGVDRLDSPRLATWVARESGLEHRIAAASKGGVRFGEILTGGRRTPDGRFLAWRVSDPQVVIADGIVPFLIDWGDTPHPAKTAPRGGTLVGLRAEHPDWKTVTGLLSAAGMELPAQQGPEPALIATIETPAGRVELR